ncbi:methyl-accepting chemotaxis protein [Paenibacillus sp. S-38]|uniref:methyl-accepting chemotaxis protein n=1 Tax=Paenibacillus sp. S-38 TaxID=3416710 RepID=UPI003CF53F1E
MRKLVGKSIRAKIIALLLSVSMIPLLIASSLLMTTSTGAMETATKVNQSALAQLSAVNIDTWLKSKIIRAQRVIDAHPEFKQGNPDLIVPVLKIMSEADPDVKAFNFVNTEGASYRIDGSVVDVSSFDNFKAAKSTLKTAVSDIRKSAATGENVIIIDIPFKKDSGEFAGLLQMLLSPADLISMISSIQDGGSYGYLLSSTGTYLIHKEVERVGKPVGELLGNAAAGFENSVLKSEDGVLDYTEADGASYAAAYETVASTGWKMVIIAPEKEVYAAVNRTRITTLVIIAASLIVVVGIAMIVARVISSPLLHISSLMKEVAQGRLAGRLEVRGEDEIQTLKANINQMLDSFCALIRKITESSETVAASSQELTATSLQTAAATEQVNRSVSFIASSSEAQYESASQTSMTMTEMAVGITRIAESASVVSEATTEVVSDVTSGHAEVQAAIRQMTAVGGTVRQTASAVQSLEEQSHTIGEIIDVIRGIAQQTNLLALNASIEAARAGEHGKGFAVVATEVKKLAEQTRTEAERITVIVSSILDNTRTVAGSVNEGVEMMSEGVGQVSKVGEIFEHVLASVRSVSNQIQEVSAASEELSAGTEEVAASMSEMLHVTKEAAEQLAQVSRAAAEQKQSMDEVSNSSQSLSEMAMELRDMVSRFTTK